MIIQPPSPTGPGAVSGAAAAPADEPADRRLGRSLVLARMAVGMTQEALAAAAGVSRATVAQIESGHSDPRLSTIRLLAAALRTDPVMLLADSRFVSAVDDVVADGRDDPFGGRLSESDIAQMQRMAQSIYGSDRTHAGWLGVVAARAAGLPPGAVVAAGIGSLLLPGAGTRTLAAVARKMIEDGRT